MSSLLTLRELDVQDKSDEALLHAFERCRDEVLRMTSSPLLPDCIAVTTSGGFIELIHVETGMFRLFLTHLGATPLQTPLRCFALLPSLFAARGRHHLLYALAHSNELLLADTASGEVRVLAAFNSRPSAVFADGDCVACGEGCGQVALWHAQCEGEGTRATADPVLAWRRAVFDDGVACLVAQRDWLVCSAVDYSCRVLAMDTGAVLAALPQEPAPAIALQSAARGSLTALCLPTSLAVFSAPTAVSAKDSAWDCAALVRLDVEVRCASCCGDLVACGAASGVVLLLDVDSREGCAVAERVRFDVGFPVIGTQLFADGTLVVVTSAGDVWKWPVEELLQATGVGEKDEDVGERAEEAVPQPTEQQLEGTGAPPHSDGGEQMPTGYDGSGGGEKVSEVLPESDEADAIVVMVDLDDEELPQGQRQEEEEAEEEEEEEEQQQAEEMEDEEENEEKRRGVDSGEDNAVGYSGPSLPPSTVSFAGWTTAAGETVHSAPGEVRRFGIAAPPPHFREGAPQSPPAAARVDGHVSASGSGGGDSATPTRAGGAPGPAAPRAESFGGDGAGTTSPRPCGSSGSAALQQLLRGTALGSPVNIEGLRRGRRMDPRRARRMAEQHDTSPDVPVGTEMQSTHLLLDYRQSLAEAVFDPATYAQEHALQAEALRYRHPVRLPACSPRAQVFAEAPRLQERPADADAEAPTGADDLIDSTFPRFVRKKDAALEEERRRGGPDIQQHMCDALLYGTDGPSGVVLFEEHIRRPEAPDTLLLPMPLPPTPSVF